MENAPVGTVIDKIWMRPVSKRISRLSRIGFQVSFTSVIWLRHLIRRGSCSIYCVPKITLVICSSKKGTANCLPKSACVGSDAPPKCSANGTNISRYHKSIINCSVLAPIVDRLYVYDNSVENVFPQLLFRVVDGKPAKQYVSIHDWANIIFQTIPRQ